MKILVVGDIHWSVNSSIIVSRGKNFSTRLENMIKSLNWVENLAKERGCEEEIFLGDFFDKEVLKDEEISAVSEIEWNNSSKIRHFLVGNHESGDESLVYSSTKVLQVKNNVIEDTPYIYPLDDNTEILFLPYITEDKRKPLVEYLAQRNPDKKLLVVSHNDIKGVQMGKFISKSGFDVDEIEQNCDLYLNGHLHNGAWVTKKILNVGNFTGQNFNEDAFKYEHHAVIVDTDTLEVEFVENPYAFNFYKIDINVPEDIKKLDKLKNQSILYIKCLDELEEEARKHLNKDCVLQYKFIVYSNITVSDVDIAQLNCVDHLKQFKDFILSREDIDDKQIFAEELNEVCK